MSQLVKAQFWVSTCIGDIQSPTGCIQWLKILLLCSTCQGQIAWHSVTSNWQWGRDTRWEKFPGKKPQYSLYFWIISKLADSTTKWSRGRASCNVPQASSPIELFEAMLWSLKHTYCLCAIKWVLTYGDLMNDLQKVLLLALLRYDKCGFFYCFNPFHTQSAAFKFSQDYCLFQWVSSSYEVPIV